MACFLWTFGQLWIISNRFCPQNCPCQRQPSWHMKQRRADRRRPESLSSPHFVIVSPLSSQYFRSFSNRWTSPSLSIRGGSYLLLKKKSPKLRTIMILLFLLLLPYQIENHVFRLDLKIGKFCDSFKTHVWDSSLRSYIVWMKWWRWGSLPGKYMGWVGGDI